MKIPINNYNKRKLREYYDSSKIDHNLHKGEIIYLRMGAVLYRDSDSVNSFFLVSSGKVNLINKKSLPNIQSFIIKPNQFFGIEEFLEDIPRISTAVALEDTLVIEIKEKNLMELCGASDSPTEELPDDIWDHLNYSQSKTEKQAETGDEQKCNEVPRPRDADNFKDWGKNQTEIQPRNVVELAAKTTSVLENKDSVCVEQFSPKLVCIDAKGDDKNSDNINRRGLVKDTQGAQITLKKFGDAVILAINSTQCSFVESGEVLSYLLEFIDQGEYNLIITLNKAETVDSTFKGALISAAKKLEIRGRELKVVCNPKVFPELVSTLNSSITLEVYSDLYEAVTTTSDQKEVA